MPLTKFLPAAALAAALATPAVAGPQPYAKPTPPVDAPPAAQPPPTAEEAGTPAAATAVDPSAPAVILQDSPTPPEDAWRLKAGDPNVISNAPVPDTVENRMRFGGPISEGGRRTVPAGN
ncbi:MAG: hypothetical protein ACOY4K_11490 [Pseudomonadota bacterium]